MSLRLIVATVVALLLCVKSCAHAQNQQAYASKKASAAATASAKSIPTSSPYGEKGGTSMDVVIVKEFGAVQVKGMPMHVHYRLMNPGTRPVNDIIVRDDSFNLPGRFSPIQNSSSVTVNKNGSAHVLIRIPLLGPSERVTRTVSLMPVTADAILDKPASATYNNGKSRSQSQSRGLYTIFSSIEEQNLHAMSSSAHPYSQKSAPQAPWWKRFPIFDEWRQRMFIGLWAAAASALPMYWFETMRDRMLECSSAYTTPTDKKDRRGSQQRKRK